MLYIWVLRTSRQLQAIRTWCSQHSPACHYALSTSHQSIAVQANTYSNPRSYIQPGASVDSWPSPTLDIIAHPYTFVSLGEPHTSQFMTIQASPASTGVLSRTIYKPAHCEMPPLFDRAVRLLQAFAKLHHTFLIAGVTSVIIVPSLIISIFQWPLVLAKIYD